MKNIKRFNLILESKIDIVNQLLNKTVERGATQFEEDSSYQKALEIIKKYNLNIYNLNIENEKVLNKLKKDLKNTKNSKPNTQMTSEDFIQWVDDNINKVEEIGYYLENKLNSNPILKKYYLSEHWEYENEQGEIVRELRDDNKGGWDFVTDDANKFIEYNFDFEFLGYLTLQESTNFINTLNKVLKIFIIKEERKTINFNMNKIILTMKLNVDELYKNIEKLKLN